MSATGFSSAGPVERSFQIRGKSILKPYTKYDAPCCGFDHVQPPLACLDLRNEGLVTLDALTQLHLRQLQRSARSSQPSDELDITWILGTGHSALFDSRITCTMQIIVTTPRIST